MSDMEKRIIIAMVFSAAVLFLYPYVLKKLYPSTQTQPATVETRAVAPAPAIQPQQAPTTAAARKSAANKHPETKEELVTVETPLFKAIFTNMGGGIKSWELKTYRVSQEKNSRVINLTGAAGKEATFNTVIDADTSPEAVVFRPSRSNIVITDKDTAELLFAGVTKQGLAVEKRYKFKGDSYTVNTSLNIQNPSAAPFNGRLETTLASYYIDTEAANYHKGPVIQTKDKLLRQDVKKEAQKTGSGNIRWLGIETKYFLQAFIPKGDYQVKWVTEVPYADASRAKVLVDVSLTPGSKAAYDYETFMGPKEYDILLKEKAGLEGAIEFGTFGFMAKPLLVILNFFERFVKNYGIAIAVLTVIIKVIFYPLTKHSLNSMKEMQKIQPQLAAIKERYKDDKEKLNKEMMELYKRYKINPVGGCLPMVLQIPVFIALYEVLYVAIELRHAPLFLWITDLSAKDPYYISPLLMGVTMFIQQKMTPTSVDPAQAKIMLVMPVIFTFMFLNFPSGLVIYWLINNVLSIAQQYYVQRPAASKA